MELHEINYETLSTPSRIIIHRSVVFTTGNTKSIIPQPNTLCNAIYYKPWETDIYTDTTTFLKATKRKTLNYIAYEIFMFCSYELQMK